MSKIKIVLGHYILEILLFFGNYEEVTSGVTECTKNQENVVVENEYLLNTIIS